MQPSYILIAYFTCLVTDQQHGNMASVKMTFSATPAQIKFVTKPTSKPFAKSAAIPNPRITPPQHIPAAAGAASIQPEDWSKVILPASATTTRPSAAPAPVGWKTKSAGGFFGWWNEQQKKTGQLQAKLAALGFAAVLAYGMLLLFYLHCMEITTQLTARSLGFRSLRFHYKNFSTLLICRQNNTKTGLFDGVSYTIAFTLAFLGYEAKTGLNPTQNVADIIKICILMWAGNNVTRPFRLAGAAALAPFMDTVMDKLQAKLRLPNKAAAFAVCVAVVALPCLAIVAGLFISRLVF